MFVAWKHQTPFQDPYYSNFSMAVVLLVFTKYYFNDSISVWLNEQWEFLDIRLFFRKGRSAI